MGQKVIVAEDDPIARKFIARAVELMGLTPVIASDGELAWRILDDNPDSAVIITDMVMPKLSGRELVEKLRADGRFSKLPILMVSAYVGPKEIAHMLELGASRFVQKPFDLKSLQGEIAALLHLPLS